MLINVENFVLKSGPQCDATETLNQVQGKIIRVWNGNKNNWYV